MVEGVLGALITLILAESALELVPSKISTHPSVTNHAKRVGKEPNRILLDRSYHHAAMQRLPDSYKRGRPDIVHITLMNAISTPLFLQNKIQIFIHTINDEVIRIGKGARLPKSYSRFVSLIEQLFDQKDITSESDLLLRLENRGFLELVNALKPQTVLGLSRIGKKSTFEDVAKTLSKIQNGAVIVGCFPRGHFGKAIMKEIDQILSIHELPLEANVVVSRLIYEVEKISGL